MKVGVDPGHGGEGKPGSLAFGTQVGARPEKSYTLDLGLLFRQMLIEAGLDVVMTRAADESVLFTQRAWRIGNADVLISLHVNYNPDPRCRGMWAYFMPGNTEAERLANLLLGAAPPQLRPYSFRKAEAAELKGFGADAVLRRYKCPAVLIEVGFASNAKDLAFMTSAEGQHAIAAGLVEGVKQYAKK